MGAEDAPDPLNLIAAPGIVFANAATIERIGSAEPELTLQELPSLPDGIVLMDISIAEKILRRPIQFSRLLVLNDQPLRQQDLATVAPDLFCEAPAQTIDASRLTDSFHLNLTAFGALSFAVGLFIVYGTIGLAFEQRRPVIRTLRALGVPRLHLAYAMSVELITFAILAGLMGLIIGYFTAAALLPGVSATLRGLYGAEVSNTLIMRPIWVATGLAMALGGTLLAGSRAIWLLFRVPVLGTSHIDGWAARTERSAVWLALSGLLMLVLGTAILLLFDGLAAGFAFLGALLVGTALLLPWVLTRVLALGAKLAKGPISQWVWADMRAQSSGLSLALMALLLAVATNIGVGTMVSSFRLTFTGWLDQRLAAEIYVTTESDAQGAALTKWLAPRSDAVLPIRFVERTQNGRPLRLYGVADHATYRENWPLLAQTPDTWDQVASGAGIVINEQLSRRENLTLGDSITLFADISLPVVGIYSDYGNPNGQALIGLKDFEKRFPEAPNRQFGVRLPRQDVPALLADLRDEFELSTDSLIDQAALKALSLQVFERTFLITGALNILTLLVAGFAIFTALLTLWTMRLPFVAPVWVLGLQRRQLARLEILRSLILAALTCLVALPLGLVLAWALLSVINTEAFGWKLPMYVFPVEWVLPVLFALLSAALAAAWPGYQLLRIAPSELLKVFTNEK